MNFGICKYSHVLLFFLLLMSQSGFAQSGQFHHLNKELGLSIRETNSICSDHHGFIWVSSKMGVIRLTDEDYKIYQLPYESPDAISVKLVFRNKQLFAYTNNGQIFSYDPLKDDFRLETNMSLELNNPYMSVNTVIIDPTNHLWIASTEGLFSCKNGSLKKDSIFTLPVEQMTWASENVAWIVNINGIYRFDLNTFTADTIYLKTMEDYFQVSSLYFDPGSLKLWLGTVSNGVFILEYPTAPGSIKAIQDLPRQPVLTIEPVNDSTIMLGIDGQGIWSVNRFSHSINGSYKENADDPASLQGNGVYDIYCDQHSRVWISTYSGGISYLDQGSHLIKQYTHSVNDINSLVNNDVNDVFEDRDGKLWFATNNGLSYYKSSNDTWSSMKHNLKVGAQVFTSLAEDKEGDVWAGTYSSGVYLFDRQSGREVNHFKMESTGTEGLSNFIFDICKDSDDDIWFGGVQGNLVCYFHQEERFRSYSFLPVMVLKEYEKGIMLAGCTFGLVQINKESASVENLLEGYLIHDILFDEKYIWLGTSGDGLIRFNPQNKEVKKYTSDDGLLSNFVNSVAYAGQFIWLGTEQGLCRLDPNSGNIRVIPSETALSGSSFNSHAHCILQNGELLWGSNNGAVQFDPALIMDIRSDGKIFIEDLIVSGTSVRAMTELTITTPLDSLQQLSLNYKQNTLGVELLPMGAAAKGAKFSWFLEGLENSWNKPGMVRTISYANLPSGRFTLRIRMYDSSLSQIIEERELFIHVTPPFWSTWWFKISLGLFIASLLAFALLQYLNHLRKEHSEQKIRFFTGVAHDIRTSVTLINSPVEELNKETKLSDQGRYYLNLAIEQSRRLSKVVTQLMDFQKVDVGKEELSLAMIDIVELSKRRIQMFQSLADSKNLKLNFTSNLTSYHSGVDEAKIEKIIDNLVSNAIKYSNAEGEIEVSLQISDSKWGLKVSDKGIGISRKSQRKLFREFYRGENAVNSKIVGSGIGLVLVKKYVDMHKGKITYTSQDSVGSIFHVVIPNKKVTKVSKVSIQSSALAPRIPTENYLSPKAPFGDEKTARKNKILIAEDNDELRNFLHTALSNDFRVIQAANGNEAWEFILKELPDVLISDIMMPGMDGFELCKLIKSTYDTSHIPVILLTSISGGAEELHGLGLGADDYLTKPFDISVLHQRIKNIIKNRELIRDKALKVSRGNLNELVFSNELNDQFVKKMLEVVNTNISNPEFSKDEFASEMNVSSSLLYKKCKALTDQSPTDFIKTLRMDHALLLIQENRHSITEISIMCGFSSIGYFSTVFKNYYGKSPTEITDSLPQS